MDDLTRSNNLDIHRVLNTVFQIAVEFLVQHPERTIFFAGSSDKKSQRLGRNQRNSVYGRMIDQNREFLEQGFKIAGIENGIILPYEPERRFEGFLIKQK